MSRSRPSNRAGVLGACCLTHAERRALQFGRPEIRLLTNQAFAANLELYAKCGYAVDRAEPFCGGMTVHMSKRVEAREVETTRAGSSA